MDAYRKSYRIYDFNSPYTPVVQSQLTTMKSCGWRYFWSQHGMSVTFWRFLNMAGPIDARYVF